jgi:hypothetical protein
LGESIPERGKPGDGGREMSTKDPIKGGVMKRIYVVPTLNAAGLVVATTNNSMGLGADSFTRRVPAGSVGFLV